MTLLDQAIRRAKYTRDAEISKADFDGLEKKLALATTEIERLENRVMALTHRLEVLERRPIVAPPSPEDLTGEPEGLRIAEVIKQTCIHYRISLVDFLKPDQSRKMSGMRSVGIYLAYMHTYNSLNRVGRKFGGRDHSSIHSAIQRIRQQLLTSEQVRRDLATIRRAIGIPEYVEPTS